MSDVFTFGETMALLRAAELGRLSHVRSMGLGIGGSESNVAIALRRLGTSVSWVGRVGADSLGDLVQRELIAEGLDVHAIRDHSALTGLMLREQRTAHSAKVSYYRTGSAGSRIGWDDLPHELLLSARVLHVTGITLALSPSASDAVRRAIRAARSAGVLVSFDLNYRAALWSRVEAARSFAEIIPLADLVFAGEEEARLVATGRDAEGLAAGIAELGPAQAVVKLGERGAVASIDGKPYSVPAVPVVAVDTVGAGDAFVGGYLAELLSGAQPIERLVAAARVGALACAVPGDWEGNPDRSDLALLDTNEPVQR